MKMTHLIKNKYVSTPLQSLALHFNHTYDSSLTNLTSVKFYTNPPWDFSLFSSIPTKSKSSSSSSLDSKWIPFHPDPTHPYHTYLNFNANTHEALSPSYDHHNSTICQIKWPIFSIKSQNPNYYAHFQPYVQHSPSSMYANPYESSLPQPSIHSYNPRVALIYRVHFIWTTWEICI